MHACLWRTKGLLWTTLKYVFHYFICRIAITCKSLSSFQPLYIPLNHVKTLSESNESQRFKSTTSRKQCIVRRRTPHNFTYMNLKNTLLKWKVRKPQNGKQEQISSEQDLGGGFNQIRKSLIQKYHRGRAARKCCTMDCHFWNSSVRWFYVETCKPFSNVDEDDDFHN